MSKKRLETRLFMIWYIMSYKLLKSNLDTIKGVPPKQKCKINFKNFSKKIIEFIFGTYLLCLFNKFLRGIIIELHKEKKL